MEVLITVLLLGFSWLILHKPKRTPRVSGNSVNQTHISTQKPVIEQPKKLNVERQDISGLTLSDEQQKIFDIIESTKESMYITGKAGTGKSVLLEYFVKNTAKAAAVVAPTGVAALNVGGQTIHSFFKLPPEVIDPAQVQVDYKTRELLRHVDVIVIDEVSMVRVDLMAAIDAKLQIANRNKLPFGGVQVVMFGDLYQLPPVVTDGELQRYFAHTYGGAYFFNAPVFKSLNLKIYELTNIFRQKDPHFRELLNSIRNRTNLEVALSQFNERVNVPIPDSGFITLAGHNAAVSAINHAKLSQLSGIERTYEAEISGDITASSYPTEKLLKLKVGAQVMMLKNDQKKPARWVNGTLGVITQLTANVVRVNIDGVEHSVNKETWEKVRYFYDPEEQKLEKETVSSFTQLPMRLAWAITIHKSQGQTYESVAIDLSDGAFAHGQAYVALSRCKSLEGLYLHAPIREQDIIIDQEVIDFMSKAVVVDNV
jgi:hypothetical protein